MQTDMFETGKMINNIPTPGKGIESMEIPYKRSELLCEVFVYAVCMSKVMEI